MPYGKGNIGPFRACYFTYRTIHGHILGGLAIDSKYRIVSIKAGIICRGIWNKTDSRQNTPYLRNADTYTAKLICHVFLEVFYLPRPDKAGIRIK